MTGALRRLMNRYGQETVIAAANGAVWRGRAFVQPVLGRGQETPERTPTPLGVAQERKYRYIGPPEAALSRGDGVEAMGRRFLVRAAEPVYVGDQVNHWWALLDTADEEEDCQ